MYATAGLGHERQQQHLPLYYSSITGLAGLGSGAFTATAWAQFPVMEVNFRTDLMAQQVKNPTVKETQKTWV